MRNVTVYAEDGYYAGWPANHGAWQWGDEMLVGFMRGPYHRREGWHSIDEPFEKLLARSYDGGDSWTVERPSVDFEGVDPIGVLPGDLDLSTQIIRVCGNYDTGGENSDVGGAFYRSTDRGHSWDGPFQFVGIFDRFIGSQWNTSRTSELGDMVFLSACDKRSWGHDYSFCARLARGRFRVVGEICRDSARCVMPKVVRLDKNNLIAVARRRGNGRSACWIDCFESRDDGVNWQHLSHVADTGRSNGNPPALIKQGAWMYCAFGDRDACAIFVYRSKDGGEWKWHATLRSGFNKDIGYPQLLARRDGQLVCVYYWADEVDDQQRIEATVFRP